MRFLSPSLVRLGLKESSVSTMERCDSLRYLGLDLSLDLKKAKEPGLVIVKKAKARLGLVEHLLRSDSLSLLSKKPDWFKVVLRTSVECACFIPRIDDRSWGKIQTQTG